ncbi:unnamed protein product [Peniophora sp. CBMAI 1063]|nr:unnamed protein product [Peniophora sp. CBMAI 1063]
MPDFVELYKADLQEMVGTKAGIDSLESRISDPSIPKLSLEERLRIATVNCPLWIWIDAVSTLNQELHTSATGLAELITSANPPPATTSQPATKAKSKSKATAAPLGSATSGSDNTTNHPKASKLLATEKQVLWDFNGCFKCRVTDVPAAHNKDNPARCQFPVGGPSYISVTRKLALTRHQVL